MNTCQKYYESIASNPEYQSIKNETIHGKPSLNRLCQLFNRYMKLVDQHRYIASFMPPDSAGSNIRSIAAHM